MPPRWDAVEVGMAIPELHKRVTTRTLVRFAGATGDFFELHYDRIAAERAGLPDVILHGYLKKAFLAEAVVNWAGSPQRLRRLSASYRGVDTPARDDAASSFTVRGHVSRVWQEGGEKLVELTLEGCDRDGTVTTPGKAVVALG
jgi:hydroxyacyl-ACP dehydratase HTD2-like protein with hotdog domain